MYEMHSLALPAVKDLVYSARALIRAGVVELVDTTDSKSVALKSVPVQVRPPVPLLETEYSQPLERPLKSQMALEFQEGGMHKMHKQSHQNTHPTFTYRKGRIFYFRRKISMSPDNWDQHRFWSQD